jgi:hypothetical protein
LAGRPAGFLGHGKVALARIVKWHLCAMCGRLLARVF